jgi:hypothetical protein
MMGINTLSLLQLKVVVPNDCTEFLSQFLQALSLSGSPQPLFVRFVDSSHIICVGLRE